MSHFYTSVEERKIATLEKQVKDLTLKIKELETKSLESHEEKLSYL